MIILKICIAREMACTGKQKCCALAMTSCQRPADGHRPWGGIRESHRYLMPCMLESQIIAFFADVWQNCSQIRGGSSRWAQQASAQRSGGSPAIACVGCKVQPDLILGSQMLVREAVPFLWRLTASTWGRCCCGGLQQRFQRSWSSGQRFTWSIKVSLFCHERQEQSGICGRLTMRS